MAKAETVVQAREARERSDAELRSLLDDKLEELRKLKFKKALGQLQKTHLVSQARRDIARLKTVLAERRAAAT